MTATLTELLEGHHVTLDVDTQTITESGLSALFNQLQLKPTMPSSIDRNLIDQLIADLDERLSQQIDKICHHPSFQALESAWRGVKFVIDRTNFRENTKIDLLNISKDDLALDFADAPETPKSGLYKLVYTHEYAQFGGEPYGALIGNYGFNYKAPDMRLLKSIAAVCAVSHAPFIAAADPSFFGVKAITELANLKDIQALFDGPQYTKWKSFRQTEDARYIGLTLPRFLLRTPYHPEDNPCRSFDYRENIDCHDDYCWGNTSAALASRLTDSFAQFRWCPNIIGPTSGGLVEDLPLHQFLSMGDIETKIPTEVLVSDRREYELSEAGFIPLTYRKGSDNAAFFSANSTQQPKTFGISAKGKQSELNYRLGTQLPYLFVISRIAHYLKVLQREQLGGWREAADLQEALNTWISQYVANQENAPAEIRSKRPLRQAVIEVSDIEGEPGWYAVDINIRPHFKYMGSDITLSLSGRIEQSEG